MLLIYRVHIVFEKKNKKNQKTAAIEVNNLHNKQI